LKRPQIVIIIALGSTLVFESGFGIFWLTNFHPADSTQVVGLSNELASASLTLGSIVLLFLTFAFAMMRQFAGRDLFEEYAWSAVGIFVSAALSLGVSFAFLWVQVWQSISIFEISLVLLLGVVGMFLVSTGWMVFEQLKG